MESPGCKPELERLFLVEGVGAALGRCFHSSQTSTLSAEQLLQRRPNVCSTGR